MFKKSIRHYHLVFIDEQNNRLILFTLSSNKPKLENQTSPNDLVLKGAKTLCSHSTKDENYATHMNSIGLDFDLPTDKIKIKRQEIFDIIEKEHIRVLTEPVGNKA